jgi:hypothetical protein
MAQKMGSPENVFFAVENEVFRVNHRNPFFPAERADFHSKR